MKSYSFFVNFTEPVWDKIMIDFIRKYFKEGLQLLEDMANKRGVKKKANCGDYARQY